LNIGTSELYRYFDNINTRERRTNEPNWFSLT